MIKTFLSNAGHTSSIPGQVAKIPHALKPKNQNIKQKQYCNKFNTLKMVHIKKKKLKKKNKSSLCMSFQLSNDPEEKGKKRHVSNIQTGVNSFLLSNWLCRVNVLDTGS